MRFIFRDWFWTGPGGPRDLNIYDSNRGPRTGSFYFGLLFDVDLPFTPEQVEELRARWEDGYRPVFVLDARRSVSHEQ